jgi:hypothetical protein
MRVARRWKSVPSWHLYGDSDKNIPPAAMKFMAETSMDESWGEHLRQHERANIADPEIQCRAKQYLIEGESTRSLHWFDERES